MAAVLGVMEWKMAPDTERSLEPDERSRAAREFQSRDLERLTLALSDQQLVTPGWQY